MKLFDFTQTAPSNYLRNSHYSSLDGFRAISIIAVVFSHVFFLENNIIVRFFSGEWGVHFFFVISGFLITTLLLKEKDKKGFISLKKFYIRRFLRIFPVAYLFLFVLFLLSIIFCIKIGWGSFISSLLYIRNLPILNAGDWQTGHFWSLSVEEQFYLFVPWLLRKNIKLYVIISLLFLISSPLLHFLLFHGYNKSFSVLFLDRLVVSQAPIIIGSLTAIFVYFDKISIPKLHNIVCVFLLLFSILILSNQVQYIPSVLSPIISSIILAVLLVASIQHTNGWFYWLMNNAIMVKIGVLSYSIYIWQQLFTHAQFWSKFGGIWASTAFNLILLAIVSYLSYYFYERWFLKLKERFA